MPAQNGEISNAASTPLGTTLIAMGIVYTAIIMPLMAGISTLTSNREADRKEIAGLYATIGELKGNKEFSQSRFEDMRRDIERAEKHLGEIAGEQRTRTSLVGSVPAIEKRLDALSVRFNEAERRGVSSPAEQISELRAEIRHLRDMIPTPVR
jgi:predicted  nucleic acid-binding Zn-ribbon protein